MWKRRKSSKISGILIKISLVIFLLLVFILIFASIRLGFFSVKEVEVEAKELGCVDENQLKDSSTVLGQNFFLINSSKIEANLKKKFLCIKSVVISKSLPDKLKLQVSTRQPLAAIITLKDKQASLSSLIDNIATPEAEKIQESYLVDEEGVVFSKDTGGLDIPRIYLDDTKIDFGKELDFIRSSLKILDKVKTFGIKPMQSWISDGFFIINPPAQPQAGPKIIFRLSDKIDIQLASLQLILAEAKINHRTIEFIDLRFDKPVVKFAPEVKNGER